jgi:mannose-6-phosphate isomerase-like protein (cupin superfamily)
MSREYQLHWTKSEQGRIVRRIASPKSKIIVMSGGRTMCESSVSIDLERMEETRIARFDRLEPLDMAFVDSLLPAGRKQNLKVIGRGVVENPDLRVPISEDHGFTVSWIRVPPQGGAHLHSHLTPEVFIPFDGPMRVFWGDHGEFSTVLQPKDCISVPVGVMRGFRNETDRTIVMLAMVGGESGGGSVTWHPQVLREAAEQTGLAVDPQGKLTQLPNFDKSRQLTPIEQ